MNVQEGQTYRLKIKDNAYWSSQDGRIVKVEKYPYTEGSYANIPTAVLVVPVDGGLSIVTRTGCLTTVNEKK